MTRTGNAAPIRMLRWIVVLLIIPLIVLFVIRAMDPDDEGAAADTGVSSGAEDLRVIERVQHIDGMALREPMLVEHPTGVLFAAGYSRAPAEFSDPPNLYRSDDGGRSWSAVDVGTPADGALGNSDVDLAVAPDGTLYFLTMGFDRSVGEGTHIAVGVSRDVGASWRWQFLSRDRFDDRPWIVVAAGGAAHVVWNDGAGVSYARSLDGGSTWTERPRIHGLGGSSHMAAGPAGELAIRITPGSASGNRLDEEVDLVAVSVDGGDSWETRPVPGVRNWNPDAVEAGFVPRWVEPIAWDAAGNLYSFWSEGSVLWLGRSDDRGVTWDTWPLRGDTTPVYYPMLAAGPGGVLAASWFSGLGDDLRAHVGLIDPTVRPPSLRATEPLLVDSWRQRAESKERDAAGEYIPVIFLANGDLGSALPVQESELGDGYTWLRISR